MRNFQVLSQYDCTTCQGTTICATDIYGTRASSFACGIFSRKTSPSGECQAASRG